MKQLNADISIGQFTTLSAILTIGDYRAVANVRQGCENLLSATGFQRNIEGKWIRNEVTVHLITKDYEPKIRNTVTCLDQ